MIMASASSVLREVTTAWRGGSTGRECPAPSKRVIDLGKDVPWCDDGRGHLVREGLDERVLHSRCRLAIPGEDPLVARPNLPSQQGSRRLGAAQEDIGMA